MKQLLDKNLVVMVEGKIIFKMYYFCILCVNSLQELAAIYTADMFVNPTYEDNYSVVDLEAQICGTTVIAYNTNGYGKTLHDIQLTTILAGDS